MSFSRNLIEKLSVKLLEAESSRTPIPMLSIKYPEMNDEVAYEIMENVTLLKQRKGYNEVGYKLGYTSKAMQEQMGVKQPSYGVLFDYMMIESGSEIKIEQFIHPKIEAEIAFVFKESIQGPNVTFRRIIDHTDYIVPILEVVDSHYVDYKFTQTDVIADNNSGARVVVGKKRYQLSEVDVATITVDLRKNSVHKETGSSKSVMGNPLHAIEWLLRKLHQHGRKINKGDIVITGGMTRAIDLNQHDVIEANFTGLETVKVNVL